MNNMDELERCARRIAAIKIGLRKDIFGERLPDDVWRQALPAAQREMDAESVRRRRCTECGQHWADPPSTLCPGCQAYVEHQQ
jgi:hypothetical protein